MKKLLSLALLGLHVSLVESILKHVIDAGIQVCEELQLLFFLLLNLHLLLCYVFLVGDQITLSSFVEGGGGASDFPGYGTLQAFKLVAVRTGAT